MQVIQNVLSFKCYVLIFLLFIGCRTDIKVEKEVIINGQESFDYLKQLEGNWTVDGGDEGIFGWEFDITSRGNVIIEKLKVGTPTEMTTVYSIDNGKLLANHYCQLNNQPNLTEVKSTIDGDIHFECNGKVGNTASHDALHMHGVHFKREGETMIVWMDMMENGKIAFETRYVLTRNDVQE